MANINNESKNLQEVAQTTVTTEANASTVENNVKALVPHYTEEQKIFLAEVTRKADEEIQRVMVDPRYYAVPYADETNCIIALHKASKEGMIQIVTTTLNRDHGSDQQKTGESIVTYGAQHVLIVMTAKMARDVKNDKWDIIRFHNDPLQDESIPDDALVVIDGNGRMDYLLGIPVEQWPPIYAVFPTKDAAGYYDYSKIIDVINTQLSTWKTENYVQKRILQEGAKAHEAWGVINMLVKKGYKYQAACQVVTLGKDRILKSEVNDGDAQKIFKNFEYAKTIYEALVKKIGEGDDKTLKTKSFGIELSDLWDNLRNKYGAEEATELFVEFIDFIPQSKIEDIKSAKAVKTQNGKVSKDARRIQILNEQFLMFCGKKEISF